MAPPTAASTGQNTAGSACSLNNIAVSLAWVGGQLFYEFAEVGRSSPCTLAGAPEVQLFGPDGHPIPASETFSSGQGLISPDLPEPVTVAAAAPMYETITGHPSSASGQMCPTPAALRMTFPGSTGVLTVTGVGAAWVRAGSFTRDPAVCRSFSVGQLAPDEQLGPEVN
jgi:hypothetical protein